MPAQPTTQRPWAAIAAVIVLTLPLGSIYAFSVFLRPVEILSVGHLRKSRCWPWS
jgi:hypothetical protein